MLVDPKLGKSANKTQIIAAARQARAQILAAAATQQQQQQQKHVIPRSKSSLPDLTFLKDYADNVRPNAASLCSISPSVLNNSKNNNVQSLQSNNATNCPVNSNNNNNNGADMFKRKTLKSIKRYRQTKQNTEPCVVVVAPTQASPMPTLNTIDNTNQNISILHDYSQQKQKFLQQQQRQFFIEQQLLQQQQLNLKEEEEEDNDNDEEKENVRI